MESLSVFYVNNIYPRYVEFNALREELGWVHEFLFGDDESNLYEILDRLCSYFEEGGSVAKFRISDSLPNNVEGVDVVSIISRHISTFVWDESRYIKEILGMRQKIYEFENHHKLLANLEFIRHCSRLKWLADQLGDEGYEYRLEAVKAGDKLYELLGL